MTNSTSKESSSKRNKPKHFNKIEQKILRVLFKTKIAMTDYELAKETGISYPTVKKYSEKLLKEGVIYDPTKKGKI